MRYTIPVPNGEYSVYLHLAETYSGITKAGDRVFDVKMEGSIAFPNLDVFAEAGNQRNKAVVKKTDVSVLDNSLTIEFMHKVSIASSSRLKK